MCIDLITCYVPLSLKFQMAAKVTIGFVKDASQHIDIQGFNVYHKNRLIKVRIVVCIMFLKGK